MALKLKDTTTLTYPTNIMKWEQEDIDPGSDEGLDISANGIKKKRRPANLCIECPVCGGPAPDHLHFGGQSCYSCRAFFRRTSPRPISSFRCRSGKNNCIINSGSKSCIPCRLTKCLQIGMDPNLVRGKKYKNDSDSDETSNQYDDEYTKYEPVNSAIPPLTPIIKEKSPESSQESLLKFRAEVLKYQGMCLQYQASLLEKQAKTMTMEQMNQSYPQMKYRSNMGEQEQNYFPKLSTDAESKYTHNMVDTKYSQNLAHPEPNYIVPKADYMAKYPTNNNYTKQESLQAEYEDSRYQGYDPERYPSKSNSPIYYSDMDEPAQPNPHIMKPKFQGSQYRDRSPVPHYRDRSPLRLSSEQYSALPTFDTTSSTRDMYTSSYQPHKQPTLPREDDRLSPPTPQSPGPMDLSIRKSCLSPQLHTQALNMPRIFFRLEAQPPHQEARV